jgi:hypothetical protein
LTTADGNVVFLICPLKGERTSDWMYGANRAMCGVPEQERGDMKKGSKPGRDPQQLTLQLDGLRGLNPKELREQWQTLFGADPPPKLRSSLLVQGIAYRLQEKAFGGLKPSSLRLLERIADDAAARRQISTTPEKVRVGSGTVLVRE